MLSPASNVHVIESQSNFNLQVITIKWDGWPLESCTWEPSDHLNEGLLRWDCYCTVCGTLSINLSPGWITLYLYRGYENPPKPCSSRLYEASRQLYHGIIMCSLKSKSSACPIYINMELDIWRFITNGKGTESQHKGYRMYSIDDLSRLPLSEHWWYYLSNEHRQGHAIRFPLKIKPVLSWTTSHQKFVNNKFTQAFRMPIDKLSIHMLKRPCDANNIVNN